MSVSKNIQTTIFYCKKAAVTETNFLWRSFQATLILSQYTLFLQTVLPGSEQSKDPEHRAGRGYRNVPGHGKYRIKWYDTPVLLLVLSLAFFEK